MAIKPDFFKTYHLSDIKQGVTYKDGKRTFRGYGTDSTDRTDNIIYITHIGLKRMVALKAFIESYKLNLTKKIEFFSEASTSTKPISEYGTDISYSLSINIPAHSVNESRNNIAKLEEIQRLISPVGTPRQVDLTYGTHSSIFSVWFKNLICSGSDYKSYPNTQTIEYEDTIKNGFMCYIEKINFEPDFEAGFFDYDDVTDRKNGKFLFPKNIKLKLELKYGALPSEGLVANLKKNGFNESGSPVCGFDANGDYISSDYGGWPFNIVVYKEEGDNVIRADMSEKTMNSIQFDYNSKNSYIFISNPYSYEEEVFETTVDGDTTESLGVVTRDIKSRYVLFKPFIESFNRNYEVNYPIIEGDKNREFGNPINLDTGPTFKSLDYSFKINVPSESLSESKKNLAKIQYLVRLLVKKYEGTGTESSDLSNYLLFYIPSFIEKAGATTWQPITADGMKDNSVLLLLRDLSIDIDLEQGFYEEKGKLYPKSYSLDFKASSNDDNLIVNYKLENELYGMLDGYYSGKEELFPFNRKTSKLKLGR